MTTTPAMRAITIEKTNVHRVAIGTEATLVAKAPMDGLWIVDVPGRGRLTFEREEFRVHEAKPAAQAPNGAPAPDQRCPDVGILRLGDTTITLTVSMTDLAAAAGVSHGRMREIIRATLGQVGVRGERYNLTVADVRRCWVTFEAMEDYGVSARQAVKILAKQAAKERG